MPSSYERGIAVAVFVLVLSVSPYAHAAGSIAVPLTQHSFQKNLQLHDIGTDVVRLQKVLNAQGFLIAQFGRGSPGNETTFFGLGTYRALVRYQKAHALPASGFFGPLTRAAINSASPASNAPSNFAVNSPGSSQRSGTWNAQAPATSSQSTIPLSLPIFRSLTFGGGGEGGGGGPSTPASAPAPTPTPNKTPPVISSISTVTLPASATTTWTTDEPATSEVVYGITTAYGSVTSSATLATSHTIVITGLASSTIYHYAVVSTDAYGNTATSSDQTFEASPDGLPLDANGFTVFTPSPGTGSCANGTYTGTCIIYVSSSGGNDSNSGLSPSTPVQTIAKGLTLLRNGYPDWLLLKKGDTWVNQAFGDVCLSGLSASQPMLFSSYGTGARPLLEVSQASGPGFGSTGGGGCGATGNDLALDGIEFYAYTRDPSSPNFTSAGAASSPSGADLLNPFNWMLIEDCKFSFFTDGLTIQTVGGSSQNLTFRRNIVTDSYSGSTNSHAEGLFVYAVNNMLVEENLFDHNGWNATLTAPATVTLSIASPAVVTWSGNVLANNDPISFATTGSLPTGLTAGTVYCVMNLSGSTFEVYNDSGNCAGSGTAINTSGSQSGIQSATWLGAEATIFNHNVYEQDNNGPSVFRNNISANASSDGAQIRAGGTVTNDLFVHNPIAFFVGSTTSMITNNVVTEGIDITPSLPRGDGISIEVGFK